MLKKTKNKQTKKVGIRLPQSGSAGQDEKWGWHNDICPLFLETDFFTVSKTSKNNSYKNHSSFPMPFTLHSHSEKESGYFISKLWYLRTKKEKRWTGWKSGKRKKKKEKKKKGKDVTLEQLQRGRVEYVKNTRFYSKEWFCFYRFSEVFNLHVLK